MFPYLYEILLQIIAMIIMSTKMTGGSLYDDNYDNDYYDYNDYNYDNDEKWFQTWIAGFHLT